MTPPDVPGSSPTPSIPDPFRLAVKVAPNASRTEFAGWTATEELRVRVQVPAVDGKANKALLAFLSKATGVSKNRLSIERGEASRQKVIAFASLSFSEWQRLPRP